MQDSIKQLTKAMSDFAKERDWDQFHSPKNLSTALAIEAAELMEPFQWLSPEASFQLDAAKREAVADELADVLLYTLRLAERLSIDLAAATWSKLQKNAAKYPADLVRGKSLKYDEYSK